MQVTHRHTKQQHTRPGGTARGATARTDLPRQISDRGSGYELVDRDADALAGGVESPNAQDDHPTPCRTPLASPEIRAARVARALPPPPLAPWLRAQKNTTSQQPPPGNAIVPRLLLLLVVHLLAAAQLSSAARGDEADLLAGHGVAADRGRVADVLVVTSTVGVLDGVHGDATGLRP